MNISTDELKTIKWFSIDEEYVRGYQAPCGEKFPSEYFDKEEVKRCHLDVCNDCADIVAEEETKRSLRGYH